jgi:glutathione S-transferase
MALNLHYWAIRGLNEPIVTLAEHAGLSYKLHSKDTRENWSIEKEQLLSKGFAFANLPYSEIDGKYTSESLGVLAQVAHLGGKDELLPTPALMADFQETCGFIGDLNNAVTIPAYTSKDINELKEKVNAFVAGQKGKIQALSDRLGKQQWLLGDKLSILDFRFAETIERMKVMNTEIGFDNYGIDFANFDAYLARFLQLSGVKEYRASERFQARPFNNTMAIWK